MPGLDQVEQRPPQLLLRFLLVAATGLVALVGGLAWDVLGHARMPAPDHQEAVLTLANPAHVLFLAGVAAVIAGVSGAFVSAMASAAGRRRGLGWIAAGVAVSLVAASAALVAVSSRSRGTESAVGAARPTNAASSSAGPPQPLIAHDHGAASHRGHDASSCRVTSAQQAAADRLFSDTKATAARFLDPDGARLAGYTPATPTSWSTVHYVNRSYITDGRILDPSHPEALVYANTARGPVLAAAMYLMSQPGEPGPEVGGCLTKWHTHNDLCFSADTLQVVGFVPRDGTCTNGSVHFVPPDMMHVWVVDVPGGPFAHDVDGGALVRSLTP
ncbi:MAG: hypothetical protein KY454_07830 [Actinobacteria bacterium]|nr:hypothetical protein [Actinomycetota bacterium]MBW3649957.1 hypothetical protein [Actinomycetota bacterium]